MSKGIPPSKQRTVIVSKPFISHHLNYGFCDLSDDDLHKLAQRMDGCIERIDLCRNKISANGVLSLKQISCDKLTLLNLSFNQIGSEGVKIISSLHLPTLKEVSLQSNNIDSTGVKHLGKVSWPSLQCLSLSRNTIKEEGIKAILSANWKNLKALNLKHNQLQIETTSLRLLSASWSFLQSIRLFTYFPKEKQSVSVLESFEKRLLLKFPEVKLLQLFQ